MANQRIDGTLTAEQLRSILHYDPDTGVFTWLPDATKPKNWNTRRAGKPAGGSDGQYGYISIRIKNALYQAHRLAWLYMTGEWPTHMIDHIDVVPDNNRWANLRPAKNPKICAIFQRRSITPAASKASALISLPVGGGP